MLAEICFLLDEQYLTITQFPLVPKEKYGSTCEKIYSGEIRVIDIVGGGVGHLALKVIAIDYLYSRGLNDYSVEAEFIGYRPDIMINDKSLFIECGTVNPVKVTAYFKHPSVKEIIIIPYPDEDNEFISGFSLTPNKDLRDFLLYLENEKMKKIKAIVRK